MAVARTGEHRAVVTAAFPLTPLMRRIVVSAPSLPRPGLLQDVAVVLPDSSAPGRTLRRRYTVRDAADDGTLALEAVLHGHGPGAAWAAAAAPGDEVVLYGPRAGAELPDATRYVLLADDAGLPAVLELLRVLAGRDVTAVVEVADAAERQPVAGITWLLRDGRAAGEPEALLAAAQAAMPLEGAAVFVLAESRVTAAVRDRLLAAGVPRAALHAKGYWNRDDPRGAGSRP